MILIVGGAGDWSHAKDGRLLLIVVGAWAAIRAVVSITWRDPAVLGPLPVGGVIAAGIVVGAGVILVTVPRWQRRTRAGAERDGDAEPSWPAPETRPQF